MPQIQSLLLCRGWKDLVQRCNSSAMGVTDYDPNTGVEFLQSSVSCFPNL